ncbi:MAG: hypothetical protein WDM96_13495 [Lacunisphaera sp.]
MTLAAAATLSAAWLLGRTALRPVGMYTGALLLALIMGLLLFNARKKLPFFPAAEGEHLAAGARLRGWLTVLVYGLHVGFRWPSGRLGMMLAGLFWFVTASGVVGLWLSRWLPPRLARSGESLIYERIPLLRHRLQTEARRRCTWRRPRRTRRRSRIFICACSGRTSRASRGCSSRWPATIRGTTACGPS